jgi:hypothetical protein
LDHADAPAGELRQGITRVGDMDENGFERKRPTGESGRAVQENYREKYRREASA